MSVDDIVASINRLEKELTGVVKATVESTLGQLGTVGAMAVDEFVRQLNVAVSQLAPVSGLPTVAPGDNVSVMPSLPVGSLSIGSGVPVIPSVAGSQDSVAPSLFSEIAVIGPSSVAKSTASKPGKNLIRSWEVLLFQTLGFTMDV